MPKVVFSSVDSMVRRIMSLTLKMLVYPQDATWANISTNYPFVECYGGIHGSRYFERDKQRMLEAGIQTNTHQLGKGRCEYSIESIYPASGGKGAFFRCWSMFLFAATECSYVDISLLNLFGVSRASLKKTVLNLMMCGVPPMTPDLMVDVEQLDTSVFRVDIPTVIKTRVEEKYCLYPPSELNPLQENEWPGESYFDNRPHLHF